jgi:cyclophilin family peptidyl-prolyl cis-trans isomerase
VHSVQKDYIAQLGDPAFGTPARADTSVYGIDNESRRFFKDEISATKFSKKGLVATANTAPDQNAGAFFITLADGPIESLFKKHTIFGEVAEGLDVLDKISRVYVNKECRPL